MGMARRLKVRELVSELLGKYQITSPPVDVVDIAQKEGAVVLEQNLEEGVSGFLYRENGTVIIGVKKDSSKKGSGRKRFTVGHELGHFLLDHDTLMHVDKSVAIVRFRDRSSELGTDAEEVEANAFAAELLMPRAMLLNDLRGVDTSDADEAIRSLASQYDVSEQAMAIRLTNLGVLKS